MVSSGAGPSGPEDHRDGSWAHRPRRATRGHRYNICIGAPALIDVKARHVAAVLLTATAALAVVSLIGDAVALSGRDGPGATKVVRMFDLDAENNVPAFFSTLIIFAAALLLAAVAAVKHRDGQPHTWYWLGLSAIFVGLSFDEYASLHETLIEPFEGSFGGPRILYFGWVVPGLAFVVVVAAVFARFLLGLDPLTRRRFVVAGAVYVGGALGVEFVEGYIASGSGEDNWAYVSALTVQEVMEMTGITLFIHALLEYLRANTSRLDLRL